MADEKNIHAVFTGKRIEYSNVDFYEVLVEVAFASMRQLIERLTDLLQEGLRRRRLREEVQAFFGLHSIKHSELHGSRDHAQKGHGHRQGHGLT